MIEAMTSITTPVDGHRAGLLEGDGSARIRLLTVQEIREDSSGATFQFAHGGRGRLDTLARSYSNDLQLARRSLERAHPVGVSFGDGFDILAMIRADNDVPTFIGNEGADPAQVLFQGHDGAFLLTSGHPESGRIRALISEAIRQNSRVWFIARKPDLAILDVAAAG